LNMKSKMGSFIFAALFAIGFGVGGYWGGVRPLVSMLYTASKVQSFVAVEAQLLDVQLEFGSEGTKGVRAEYRYSFNQKVYESSRVGLHNGGSDNIGNWHDQWFQRLKQAKENKKSVTVWLDPNEPQTALIDKQIRWPFLWFLIPFAVLFPAVALGALWMMYKIVTSPADSSLPERPDNQIIKDGVTYLSDKSKSQTLGIWIFALVWNILVWPFAVMIWSTDNGVGVKWFVLIFLLVGLGLLFAAVKTTLTTLRVKGTLLSTSPADIYLGESFSTTVKLPLKVMLSKPRFEIRLCENRIRENDSSPTPRTVWSQVHAVSPRLFSNGSGVMTIAFDLPFAGAASGKIIEGEKVFWALELTNLITTDTQSFEVEVFPSRTESIPLVANAESSVPVSYNATLQAAWIQAGGDDFTQPITVSPKVIQVVERNGQWIASFPYVSMRLIGLAITLGISYLLWLAREAFTGDSSADVISAIALLATVVLGLGVCIHCFTVRWQIVVDQRSVRQQTKSWLKTRQQEFAHADILGYDKKLAYRQSQAGSTWKDMFCLYAVLADKRRVQMTPSIATSSSTDAVADLLRHASRNYTQRFAGQPSDATPWHFAKGYGLWLLMAVVAVSAVSLNTTYRIFDPVNPERIAKEWQLRLNRLSPAGRLHNDVLTAQNDANMEALEALLKKGADPNTVANNGITMLMLAARRGTMRNVDLLLQYGADVNQRDETSNDNRGDTALLVALHAGREDMMHRLLKAGASLDARNMWDWTPVHMAAQGNCIPCLEYLKSKSLDMNAKAIASRGETPAMLAAGKGRLEALQWFVQNGVDLKEKDPTGKTALDWAVFFNKNNTAQWLREQ
jgi:hypothetical protein